MNDEFSDKWYCMYNPLLDKYMEVVSGGGPSGYEITWTDRFSNAERFQFQDIHNIDTHRSPRPFKIKGQKYDLRVMCTWVFVPLVDGEPAHKYRVPTSFVWGKFL